jgi:hypothetical protein
MRISGGGQVARKYLRKDFQMRPQNIYISQFWAFGQALMPYI